MAVRSYNGRELLVSPNMVGTGSTSSNNSWIGDNSQRWGMVQSTSGNGTALFDTFLGKNVIKLTVSNLTRTGGSVGLVNVCSFFTYPASTLTPANLSSFAQRAIGGRTYTVKLTYYIESLTATTGATKFGCFIAYYDSNGTRLTGASPMFSTTLSSSFVTFTGNVTAPVNTAYVIVRAGIEATTDPTTGGGGIVYISNFSLTEVLTRTLISTPRTLASNRVLTRDMGTALSFDGVSNKVVLPTALNTILSKSAAEFSVEYTFKSPEITSLTVLLASSIDTNDRFAISFGSGTVRIGVYNGVSWNSGSGGIAISPNQWYTLSLRAVAGLITRAMINGVTKNPVGGSNPISAINAGVTIGCRTDSSSFSKHTGDSFRIWNRALTDTEMQNSYFNNIVPRNGLVGEWLFNDIIDTTALDSSGNENNGTITGATYTTDTPLKLRTLV